MAQADSVPTLILEPITGAISRACTKGCVADRAQPDGRVDLTENQRWYESVTGQLAPGLYSIAVGYAIVVILMGWWRWNLLMLLLAFPICNKRVRFFAFPSMRSNRFSKANSSHGNLP